MNSRLLVVTPCLAFIAHLAQGGTVFTSRAAFEAALGNFTIETFEDAPLSGTAGGGAVASIAFDDFTVTANAPGGGPATKLLGAPAFGSQNTTPGGSRYLYIDTDIGFSGFAAEFDFSEPQFAFGFDYAANNNSGATNVINIDGSQFVIGPSSPTPQFWGFIASSGSITGASLLTSDSNSALGIDQVTYQAVPEPASLALITLGLLVGNPLKRKRT